MSDEVVAHQRVVAQCRHCLAGLDPLLSAAWHASIGSGSIEELSRISEIYGLGNLDVESEARHQERLSQLEAECGRATQALEDRLDQDMAVSTAQRDRERANNRGAPPQDIPE